VSPNTTFDRKEHRLPDRLLELVKNSPEQTSLTEYDAVHAWWWAVWDDMIEDMKVEGESSGWREVQAMVKG
jgi:hypothetical protein